MTPQGIEGAVRKASEECAIWTRRDQFRNTTCVALTYEFHAIMHKHLDPAVQPLVEALERIVVAEITLTEEDVVRCFCCGYRISTGHHDNCAINIARAALETWRRDSK